MTVNQHLKFLRLGLYAALLRKYLLLGISTGHDLVVLYVYSCYLIICMTRKALDSELRSHDAFSNMDTVNP